MPARTAVDRSAIPPDALGICVRLAERGHGAWVVGGCVRDHLLGRAVADWDICTTALPDELRRLFPRSIPTGIEHGTITVVVNKVHYEVTTLRGETSYGDGRRPDAVFFVTDLAHDLERRDFTINAIAYDPTRDRLEDPFDGVGDLDRRVIRAVGDPMRRFGEDGLRVLRAARFVATLEFELDAGTASAIGANLETFRKVSGERVRDEWLKTMKARRPSRAFEVMRATGILGVVCPALLEGVGCAQGSSHAYDVWEHSLRTLDAVPPGDAILRLTALLHDLGKPRTREVRAPGAEPTFVGHERVGAELAGQFLRDYRFSNEERARVTHLVQHHRVSYDGTWTDARVRRFVRAVGRDVVAPLFVLCRADVQARGGDPSAALGRLDALRARIDGALGPGVALATRELAINGTDLQRELGIAPSRKLGELLNGLLERVLEDPALNTRERLLALARELLVQAVGP